MIAECARGQLAAMVFSLVACLVASPGVRAQAAPDYAPTTEGTRRCMGWNPPPASITPVMPSRLRSRMK